jgi:hypothetical protein
MKDKWLKKLNANPIDWLLNSNPWTKYKTLTDLLEKSELSDEVKKVKKELINDPKIIKLIDETGQWFTESITRHNIPTIPYYKLLMLSDFGLNINDNGIDKIIQKINEHIIEDMFAVRQTLPEKTFKLPDKKSNEWHVLPCDTPVITYSMLCLKNNDKKVLKSVDKIKEKWQTSYDWFCHFFFVEGQFKKNKINCPISGLMALNVFSQVPELKESKEAKNAFLPIKFHKEYGKSIYYFGRSKKFWAFKYPFIWYNALYLADVLTKFDFLIKDDITTELINWILKSQDESGRFKPTSMFKAYKEWDFSNKKKVSPWMTFLCCRILKRWYN